MNDFFESEEELEDIEGNELISRYEGMIAHNQSIYLSVDDYEFLFMHYICFYNEMFAGEKKPKMAAKVIRAGIEQYPTAPLLNVFWIYNQYLNKKISTEKAVKMLQSIEFPQYERFSQSYHLAAVYTKVNALDAARALYESMLKEACSSDDKERIYFELIFISKDIFQILNYLIQLLKISPRGEQQLLDELYIHFSFRGKELSLFNKDNIGISFFKLYADTFPFSAKGWQCLSEAYSSQLLFENAVEAMNNAVAISSEVDYIVFLADIYRLWGKNAEALEAYKEAMAIEPDNKTFFAEMADVYHLLEQYERAIYYFGIVLDENPDHLPALMGMALSCVDLENYHEAVPYLQRAISIEKTLIEAWLLMADCYVEMDDDESALQLYQKTTVLFSHAAEFWLSYSNYYVVTGDMPQAYATLSRGLKLLPGDAQLLYRKANYYFLDENYLSGVACLRYAHMLNGTYLNQFLDYDEQTAMLPVVVEVINELMHKNEMNDND